jgi:signal transduction histidine kinase
MRGFFPTLLNPGAAMGHIQRLWLVCLCLCSLMAAQSEAASYRDAQAGVVDLAGWRGESTLALSGTWYFFPHELLEPQEFLQRITDPQFQAQYAIISQSFLESSAGREPNHGYATYVLRIKNWPTRMALGFVGIDAYTASRTWFFGQDGQGTEKPVQALGLVGTSAATSAPQIRTSHMEPLVAVEEQDYFFLIQVSNFYHAWGGLWDPPEVASIQVLNAEEKQRERLSFFVVGCLIFAAAYSFSLFSRRKEDRGSLYLGFMAVVLAFRSASVTFFPGTMLGSHFLAYAVGLKALYMMMMLVPLLAGFFIRCYFPSYIPRSLHKGFVILLSLASVFFALAPPHIFSHLATAAQIGGMVSGSFYVICALRALRAGERGAIHVILGSSAVLVGAAFDIAAEKGWIHLPLNVINLGFVTFIMLQSQIVAVHFAYAFRRAEHLSRELKSEVERQTRDIKSILENIQQGIFTLVGDGLTIGSEFSDHLKKIVRKESVAGSRLEGILLDHSDLSGDAKSQTMAALNAAMGEDPAVFDLNAHCLASELGYTPEGTEQLRTLELEWTPMVDNRQTVDKILVCVRDVTEIRSLQEKAREQEEELGILQEILKIPEERFQRFIQKTEEYLKQNRQLILNAGSYRKADVVRNLFMNMHTIKGTARTYFLHAISSASHDVEQYYAALQREEVPWQEERLLNDLDRVGTLVQRYDQVGRDKLGWSSADKVLRLPRRRLLDGLDRLITLHDEPLSETGGKVLTELESILMESCYCPIHTVLEDACKGADSLARDLHKHAPDIQIEPSNVILRDDGADLLHSVLIHLVRNALDHGLETPEVRVAAGKPPQGRIQIGITEQGPDLALSFSDDGQGLDLERIESKAREAGLLQPDKRYAAADLADLIFQSGLSTKDTVTEVSGRGVGMDAVRNYLESAGGEITLQLSNAGVSGPGWAFRFEIILPAAVWWSPTRHRTQSQVMPLKQPC